MFFPLYPEIAGRVPATRSLLGIRGDAPAKLDFEVILPGGDGTNIDVLIEEADGRRLVVEVKLTESAFGRARNDLRHREKLRTIYTPLLRGRVADSVLQQEVFFRDYQLLRNLAQLRGASDDHAILLLPRARPQLWESAATWCARPELGEFSGRIRPVALEDLAAALRADAEDGSLDPKPIAATASKYLAHAG